MKGKLLLLSSFAVVGYFAMPCITDTCKTRQAAAIQANLQDQEYQQRNHVQQGEKTPQYDYKKFSMIKIANRFLIWPNQYGSDRAIAFFWPSKTPTITMPQPKGEGKINIFFTDMYLKKEIIHYDEIVDAYAKNNIKYRKNIKNGLDIVEFKKNGRGAFFYVATKLKDSRGQSPTLFCPNDPINEINHINIMSAGANDIWNGVLIEFRFSNAYCQDWPEIYQHGMSIIRNHVKEVQP